MHFRAYDDLENKSASIPVEDKKILIYKKVCIKEENTSRYMHFRAYDSLS